MRLSTGTTVLIIFQHGFPPIMLVSLVATLSQQMIWTADVRGGDRLKPGDLQCPLLGVKRT